MTPLISIIVPVYNAEKTLRRCINSIIHQTFVDWELLLIDDGSKDTSGQICDEYVAKDCRIKVFHKENGGVSSARNLGLNSASGKWVTFVDSDDYVDSAFLAQAELNSNDINMIVFGVTYLNSHYRRVPSNVLKVIEESPSFIDEQLCEIYMMTCWGKCFRMNIIRKECIYFNELLKIGEDTEFVLHYLKYSKNIQFVDTPCYFYNDEEIDKLYKYALDANSFCRHMSFILGRLNELKRIFNYNFILSDKLLKVYYSRLFFVKLLTINSYAEFLNEYKLNKEVKEIYVADSLKKEFFILLFFYLPSLAYVINRIYGRILKL